nr:Kelch-like protein 20a-A-3 [Carassius gibelio]
MEIMAVNLLATSPSTSTLPPSPCEEDSFPLSSLDSEDYVFVEARHPNKVLEGLNSLRLNNAFCDVTLCCGGQEFPCHRIVLASFSSYFQAMFSTDLMESRQERVAINGVEPQMIGMLVSYAYTAEVVISRANVQALLAAANLLDVMAVREACCRFMERQMDEMNCVGIHCFAEAHSCPELERRSMEYIQQHFSTVCQQEEFLSLCADKLTEIISSDHLNVPKEETVFEAAVVWLEKNTSRRQSFEKVLEHIRLPLISPYYIHDVIETLDVVKESIRCQKLISEAKDYLLLQDRRGELYSPRARPRRATGTAEVIVTVGGEDDKVVLRSVESFDPLTSQWKSLACLPFAVSKHGLVVSGSMLYLAGGEFPDGSASREMWRYDPCFDSWTEMAPMNVARSELGNGQQICTNECFHGLFQLVVECSLTPCPMSSPCLETKPILLSCNERERCCGCVSSGLVMLDGYVFAVGGWEGRSRLDSVECYNPQTNTWQFMDSVKMAVTSPAVVALDGLLYVTGGAVLEDGDGTNMAQVYNPKTCVWTEVSPMQIARSGSAACVLKGKIYVIGGWHASTENTDKVECYDPRTNSWTMCAPMKERRYRPGVAVVDGKIYVLGGEEGWDRYHDTIERYCEESDRWEMVGEMPSSRSWLSCVSLQLRKDTHTASDPDTAAETEFPVD